MLSSDFFAVSAVQVIFTTQQLGIERKDDHWRCRIKNQTVFCKSFICILRIYLNRKPCRNSFYVEKVEKKKQLFTEKVNDILHGKSHFFSIRPINRVQSQALNSEIKCEKKGIMNKWDAEKSVDNWSQLSQRWQQSRDGKRKQKES